MASRLLFVLLSLTLAEGYMPQRFVARVPRVAATRPRAAAPVALDGATAVEHVSTAVAFADQAGNLAGVLFPASLPPYLLFLYFINQEVNGLSATAKVGFTSLLAFVIATVVTSIIAVKSYDLTLANVDWLHAGAEQLLSFTNVANVIGLKLTLDRYNAAAAGEPPPPTGGVFASPVLPALGGAALLTLGLTWAAASGTLGDHSAFLGGIGNLPEGLWTLGFFAEPANALSLPTWVIHVSSLLEWLVAMGLVWRIGTASGNPKWKGLTWAMIPSHSSGICACVYHFFYNAPSLQFVVLLQAALTLIGNTTLAFAAYRLAISNGYTFSLPLLGDASNADTSTATTVNTATAISTGKSAASPTASLSAAAVNSEAVNSEAVNASGGDLSGLLIVLGWSIIGSYIIKYGETLLPFVVDADSLAVPLIASLMIGSATGFNCWKWRQRSQDEADFGGII